MSEMLRKIRNRRFNAIPDEKIKLVAETPTGSKIQFTIDNISMSGLGCTTDVMNLDEEGFELNGIIPAAKIVYGNSEMTLGRLVLRSMNAKDETVYVGFSCIDTKIPIDGALSKYFQQDFDNEAAPFDYELSPDKFSLASFAEHQGTGVDLFSKVHHFNVFMRGWRKTAKFAYMNVRKPSMGQRILLERPRRSGRQDYIVMGSNDYLGLASHPEVLKAAKDAIDRFGFGSTGSPATTGVTDLHVELTDYLAKILGKEKVILFNSGYAANVGLISGLVQAQDLVIADMIAHASIQDAMQMCKGSARFFKHNNPEHLEKALKEQRDQYSGCLVVTEGVFSMDGDVAPLDQIVQIAKDNKARIMVDEAHSFGVIGQTGLGACEKYGVLHKTDLIMGTFSKICGGIGGFVATTEEAANWLYFWARSHTFSVSIPPSTAAAALRALEIFRQDRSLLDALRANIAHFKRGLASLGYHLPHNHESAVIPVVVGDEKKLEIMNEVFMEAGVFVVPIVYPAVGRTNCRFRFTVTATHTVSDLDYVLNVLELAMEKAQFRFHPAKTQESGSKAS